MKYTARVARRRCMECTYGSEYANDGWFVRGCRAEATHLVDGAPRCAEHRPTVEPITPEAIARLEDEAFAAEVASARPPRPRRAPGWRARARDDAFTDDDWDLAEEYHGWGGGGWGW